jgi:hypothetical protein
MVDNDQMSSALVPMHLGDLHAYETALLALLAFGPFVVLAVVVVVMRRRDDETPTHDAARASSPDGDEARQPRD